MGSCFSIFGIYSNICNHLRCCDVRQLPHSQHDLHMEDFPDFPSYWIGSQDAAKMDRYKWTDCLFC